MTAAIALIGYVVLSLLYAIVMEPVAQGGGTFARRSSVSDGLLSWPRGDGRRAKRA